MCVQVPCVYLLYAASTVTIRNSNRTHLETARYCVETEILYIRYKAEVKKMYDYSYVYGQYPTMFLLFLTSLLYVGYYFGVCAILLRLYTSTERLKRAYTSPRPFLGTCYFRQITVLIIIYIFYVYSF